MSLGEEFGFRSEDTGSHSGILSDRGLGVVGGRQSGFGGTELGAVQVEVCLPSLLSHKVQSTQRGSSPPV